MRDAVVTGRTTARLAGHRYAASYVGPPPVQPSELPPSLRPATPHRTLYKTHLLLVASGQVDHAFRVGIDDRFGDVKLGSSTSLLSGDAAIVHLCVATAFTTFNLTALRGA